MQGIWDYVESNNPQLHLQHFHLLSLFGTSLLNVSATEAMIGGGRTPVGEFGPFQWGDRQAVGKQGGVDTAACCQAPKGVGD